MPFKVMGDNTLVCEACYITNYDTCNNCNKFFKKIEMREMTRDGETKRVCKRCFEQYYRECAECHQWVDRHDCLQSPNDGKTICKPCFNKSYQICGRCQVIGPKGCFSHSLAGGTRHLCDSCYNQYGPITEYNSKPNIIFYGISHLSGKEFENALRRTHFYGIELEVEMAKRDVTKRGAKADEVLKLLGTDFAITKEDGSVKYGFEICTAPATIIEHRSRWQKFFEKMPEGLVSWNAYDGKCGLHVHCSKKPLSLLTIAKMVVFVNNPDNQRFVETVAGRGSNQYFKFEKKEYSVVEPLVANEVRKNAVVTMAPERMNRLLNVRQLGHDDRYEAINLVNKDTIEFRIFKGTLKQPSFFKALEFCDALTHFCMMGTNSISYCKDVAHFIDYVGLRAKDYPHLYAFICAKILKKETKQTKEFGFNVGPATDNQQ